MEFGQSIKTCFSKYATFSGRASRSEFWWFYLFYVLIGYAIGIIMAFVMVGSMMSAGISENPTEEESLQLVMSMLGFYGIVFLLYIPLMIPFLAVSMRRLHDTGHSGWHLWGPTALMLASLSGMAISAEAGFVFVIVGYLAGIVYGIVIFVWLVTKSSPTENQYGPVPEGVYPVIVQQADTVQQ